MLKGIVSKLPAVLVTMTAILYLATPASAAQNAVAAQDAYGGQGAVLTGSGGETGTKAVLTGSGRETGTGTDDGGVAKDGSTGVATAATASQPAPVLNTDNSAELPFTGFDLLALLGGGLVLVMVGMSVRQVARRPV